MLCYVVLCGVVWCGVVLCCVVLCWVGLGWVGLGWVGLGCDVLCYMQVCCVENSKSHEKTKPTFGNKIVFVSSLVEKSKWEVIKSSSAFGVARYGHSSVYDPISARIFVYAGIKATSGPATFSSSDDLLAYYPQSRKW